MLLTVTSKTRWSLLTLTDRKRVGTSASGWVAGWRRGEAGRVRVCGKESGRESEEMVAIEELIYCGSAWGWDKSE